VPVGSDAPGPAVYDLEVGLFNLETGERLPAADEAGNLLGLTILGKVKVLGPVAAIPGSTPRLDANFADQITLLGYELGPVRQGRGPIITLYWQARTTVTADYTVFLHVLDESGHLVGQGDAPPQAGRYPTSWWDAGEIVVDAHTIDLPADATPGIYSIVVGWYSPQTGERLPLIGPPAGDALELGSFQLDLVR